MSPAAWTRWPRRRHTRSRAPTVVAWSGYADDRLKKRKTMTFCFNFSRSPQGRANEAKSESDCPKTTVFVRIGDRTGADCARGRKKTLPHGTIPFRRPLNVRRLCRRREISGKTAAEPIRIIETRKTNTAGRVISVGRDESTEIRNTRPSVYRKQTKPAGSLCV